MLTPCPDEAVGPPSAGTMPLGKFTGRLLVVLVIAALAGALWQLADILVLLFGAVTLAIGLFAASTAEFGGALRCRGFFSLDFAHVAVRRSDPQAAAAGANDL